MLFVNYHEDTETSYTEINRRYNYSSTDRIKYRLNDLEAKASIEINVSILFGLEVGINAFLKSLVEVLMENSFVFLSCVWCGVAFLRGLGGTLPIQTRD